MVARQVAVGVVALIAAACGASADDENATVTVLAAASLTEPFTALADELERDDVDVSISFGPSSGLVEQVLAGARADVIATADTATMDAVAPVAGDPAVFARNTLTLAVPGGNPAGVTSLSDLGRDELRIALCEPQVPCGAAAEELLRITGIAAAPDTLENDVKDVAGKVVLGEIDAALIYRTDAAASADSIDTIDVPEAEQVVNDYPVAILDDAANRARAQAFVDALTGEPGRRILTEAGFVVP